MLCAAHTTARVFATELAPQMIAERKRGLVMVLGVNCAAWGHVADERCDRLRGGVCERVLLAYWIANPFLTDVLPSKSVFFQRSVSGKYSDGLVDLIKWFCLEEGWGYPGMLTLPTLKKADIFTTNDQT
eukprot:3154883-Amphidinium_carterae.1